MRFFEDHRKWWVNPWLWLSVILFVSFSLRHAIWLIHPDAAWFAIIAGKLLDGERLFHDIFDVNHPFVTLLHMPIAVLQGMGLNLTVSAHLYFHISILIVIVLCHACLKATGRQDRDGSLLLWLIIFVLILHSGEDLGQKEHLGLAAILPFLLLSASREPRPVILSLLAALIAGFAFALKPQFLGVIGLVVVGRFMILRQFSLQLWFLEIMTLAFLALFLCASLLIWPEFVATTLDFSLAFYNQTGKSLVFLLSGFLITGGFVPALIALLLLLRARRNADPQTVLQSVLFFAAGLGFLIAYLHQAHGILYQAYPAAALFVLAAMGSLTFVQRERVRRAATAFVLAGAALYTYVSYAHSGVLWSDVKADPAKQYLMQDMRGKSVYVVAPLFEDGLPIGGLADWDWTSRYPGFWMVTLIEGVRENSLKAGNKDHVAQLNRILHDVRRASVEDLKKRKPDYIVCFQRESTEPCLLQAFLLKDPDFAAEFRYYRAHKSFPLISIYRRIGQ